MGTQQAAWLAMVQAASKDVKAARLLDADWPAGTLEAADFALDATLAGQGPPPDPPPATLQGFGVTYHYPGADHSPAVDVYLADNPDDAEWGRHWGWDVLAPASGKVTAYTFPTPLMAHVGLGRDMADLAAIAQYHQNHADLFRDALRPGSCYLVPPTDAAGILVGAQTMYFSLLQFDTPQRAGNGQMVRAIWIGHCRGDIPAGHVDAGQRFATTWHSGINFEAAGIQARAAHAHTCGTATGQLTMNGDVNGFVIADMLGWKIQDRGIGPGPNEYLTGQWIAGKSRATWGNRPLPPVPS